MNSTRPAERGSEFEEMMAEIDAKLIHDGIGIPWRPIQAMREVSLRFNIDIPLFSHNGCRMPENLRRNLALSDAINRWYNTIYGDRLNVDPCLARMVVLIDGDLYILRIPRIYGTINFIASREWVTSSNVSTTLVNANIVQLLEGMTPAKAARLSDATLAIIFQSFQTVFRAAYTIHGTDHPLITSAKGDAHAAVEHLMAQPGRYGAAKWDSLQVAEKVIKAALGRAGLTPQRTHNLTALINSLISTGIEFDAQAQIAAIQCTPGIRYGDELCTLEEALAAHQAAYELINILREAGASLQSLI